MQMPGLLRWSARYLRSARRGGRAAPPCPGRAAAAYGGRRPPRPSPPGVVPASSGCLPAPRRRWRLDGGVASCGPRRRAWGLPRALFPPLLQLRGGRGRRLRRRFKERPPGAKGAFFRWCAARRGFRPSPSRPPPSGPGEAQGYESAAAGFLALRARFPT